MHFWGVAPAEIIQFLLESNRLLYPTYEFNWTMMVETMGKCDTPKESIENLVLVRLIHFPDQLIDWGYLLNEFSLPLHHSFVGGLIFQERMQYLVMSCFSSLLEDIDIGVLCDWARDMIYSTRFSEHHCNQRIIAQIQDNLYQNDDETHNLKEATTILELALWKMRINEESHNKSATRSHKKMKADESIYKDSACLSVEQILSSLLCCHFSGFVAFLSGVR